MVRIVPYNPEFGRRFTDLLDSHGLKSNLKAYRYLEGLLSKSSIRNWRIGAPAPGPLQEDTVRAVIAKFPDQSPESWLTIIRDSAA